MSADEILDTEIELLASSLLPEEELGSSDAGTWPREITITNTSTLQSLHVVVTEGYPASRAVSIQVKGNNVGREEAAKWDAEIGQLMDEWDEAEDYPLFQLLSTHVVPRLAEEALPTEPPQQSTTIPSPPEIPHHVLLTSHHLLSPTKRKHFLQLSSQLSLTGFSKVGHPGIYYALGDKTDLEEWLREVKSWNWLALRVRIGIEPVPGEVLLGRGREEGARGGKGRGDWVELDKISEALAWLKERGRGDMLIDIGIGGSGEQ